MTLLSSILFYHVMWTCDLYDITFCLLCLCLNKEKEKETQNKIKKHERNRIKPSLSFATLTVDVRIAESRHSFFSFLFLFYLVPSIYFSFVLFLAPRVRVSDNIGHIAQRRF